MNYSFAKLLMVLGAVLFLVGLLVYLLPTRGWGLGRLPGDIRIERENVRVFIPLTTGLLLTLLLNAVIWIVRRFL
jgi:hypothetical protein